MSFPGLQFGPARTGGDPTKVGTLGTLPFPSPNPDTLGHLVPRTGSAVGNFGLRPRPICFPIPAGSAVLGQGGSGMRRPVKSWPTLLGAAALTAGLISLAPGQGPAPPRPLPPSITGAAAPTPPP